MNTKKKEISFQNNTVEKGIEHLKNNKEFKLQSPTGSGKTLIVSMLIEKFLEDLKFIYKNYTFIFIAPSTGKLDHQGYKKISNYLDNKWVSGFRTEYIGTTIGKAKYLQNIDFLKKNTVYFLGWGLFSKNSNLTNIDSERNNLHRVLNNTRIKKNKIVLIIDEAHREYRNINSNTKKSILKDIKPSKIIELSATLDKKADHKITLKDVRSEAGIKKNVIINCTKDSDNFTKKGRIEECELLINDAIKKQEKVKKEYFKKNIKINPLILIQIPNNPLKIKDIGNMKVDDFYINQVKNILERDKKYKEGINYSIWCNKNKTKNITKDDIIKNDSPIEILIFKQAIATGWDIPRANILVKIREVKKLNFIIQTLGRILRNPFYKYYENDYIDNAFVFTKDENYKSKIETKDFVTSNITQNVNISKKGKKIKDIFKINKIIYENSIYVKDISNQILNELIDYKNLIERIIEKSNNLKKEGIKIKNYTNIEIDTLNLPEEQNASWEKINESTSQKKFNFSEGKERKTLFEIFIKYKSFISKDLFLHNTIEKLSNYLSQEKHLNKKDFYNFIIFKSSESINEEGTLFEIIENFKNKILKPLLLKFQKKEKFYFNDSIQLYEKMIEKNKDWDKINTYNFSLNIESLDSKIEKSFYKKLKDFLWFDDENLHVFRNIDRHSNSYFIEYFDKNYKKLKFYPDFILFNNKTKCALIIEIKGRGENDIDKNTTLKVKQMNDLINEIKTQNFNVNFFKCQRKLKEDDEFELIDYKENSSVFDFKDYMRRFIK